MSKTLFSQSRPATRPPHPLCRDEYARLLAELPPHRQAFVEVAVYTGARRGELEALQLYDVDMIAGLIRIRGGKAGPARYVPLAPELRPFLDQHPGGKLLSSWPSVVLDLAAACRAVGIMPRVPSDLRNTYALWQARTGISPRELARRMGHFQPDDDERQDDERDTAPRRPGCTLCKGRRLAVVDLGKPRAACPFCRPAGAAQVPCA